MADTLLKEGTPTTLSFTNTTPADGARYASNAVVLGATDATARPDLVRVDVEATGTATSAGGSLNAFASCGNTAGEYDGNITPSVDPGAEVIPNLDEGFSLIVANGTLQRASGIFMAKKARVVIVVENQSGDALSALKVVLTPLNYTS